MLVSKFIAESSKSVLIDLFYYMFALPSEIISLGINNVYSKQFIIYILSSGCLKMCNISVTSKMLIIYCHWSRTCNIIILFHVIS